MNTTEVAEHLYTEHQNDINRIITDDEAITISESILNNLFDTVNKDNSSAYTQKRLLSLCKLLSLIKAKGSFKDTQFKLIQHLLIFASSDNYFSPKIGQLAEKAYTAIVEQRQQKLYSRSLKDIQHDKDAFLAAFLSILDNDPSHYINILVSISQFKYT